MKPIVRIENAILAIDPADFQRLGDAYLTRLGCSGLNQIGLCFGTEKTTTGTPDTLVARDDGKYVFVEYTTQQSGVAEKFSKDIDKCLDSAKTGIPVDRVAEIILCYNGKLTADEEFTLREKCRTNGIIPRLIGLSALAQEIYYKWPQLARDFLDVELDTGQILEPAEFTTAYEKSQLAVPIGTPFHFREEEVQNVLDQLSQTDVVLITGAPGIGKTRLTLECLRRYSQLHPDVRPLCVINRGADLFQDLRNLCSAPGHYLIMVDDANRVTKFEYVVELLRDTTPNRTIKILATVRDYALEPVLQAANGISSATPIKLAPFTHAQILTLVKEAEGITDLQTLERIGAIAQGNARVAIMAARVAKAHGTFRSLDELYDQYYQEVRKHLSEGDSNVWLRVAAIVALLSNVDRTHEKFMEIVVEVAGLSLEDFWDTIGQLHEQEVVDMHGGDLVKVSDQVLATYLFFLACFRTKTLDLGQLFATFYPNLRQRFIDVLNPIFGVFNTDETKATLDAAVERAIQSFKDRGDNATVLLLRSDFWFLRPSSALSAAQVVISSLDPEPVPDGSISFERSGFPETPPIELRLLAHFSAAKNEESSMAIGLIVDYFGRRATHAVMIGELFKEAFGIGRTSDSQLFSVQINAASTLITLSSDGKNRWASLLFIAYAKEQLKTHFSDMAPVRDMTVTWYNFTLHSSPALHHLRSLILGHAFDLYKTGYANEVRSLLKAYIRSGADDASRSVLGTDAALIESFLVEAMDPKSFDDCVQVHDYLDLLDRLKITHAVDGLRERFTNSSFELAQLLNPDVHEKGKGRYSEQEEAWKQRLAIHAKTLAPSHLRELLSNAADIIKDSADSGRDWWIKKGIAHILTCVAADSPTQFTEVLLEHLLSGNSLRLQPYQIVQHLIGALGPEESHKRLLEGDWPLKWTWLSAFFASLDDSAVNAANAERAEEHFRTAPGSELGSSFESLQRFELVSPGFIVRITETLIARYPAEQEIGHVLKQLFNPYTLTVPRLAELFKGHTDVLKSAYFIANDHNGHADFDGRVFELLLELESSFGNEWVQWLHDRKKWVSIHDDSRQYSFIWRRPDHAVVMEGILSTILEQSEHTHLESYAGTFFSKRSGDEPDIIERQNAFLDDQIERYKDDKRRLYLLFEIISEFEPSRRTGRIATLVKNNKDLKAFQSLKLKPSFRSWSGSAVPLVQAEIDFYTSLLPLMNELPLLDHREYLEEIIRRERAELEQEKRNDFLDHG